MEVRDHTTEAAIATITLPENIHDFDTTMAELDKIDVQAQITMNCSRPEEITIQEDFSTMTHIGDHGFGDLAFDDYECFGESSQLDSLEPRKGSEGSTTDEPAPEQPSELPTSLALSSVSALPGNNTTAGRDQSTLTGNEQFGFILEPVDALPVRKRQPIRKRKLVVDEHQSLTADTIKDQLAVTSDVVSALDLAPPTKKLRHWKETGGVKKLFALPGRPLPSKYMSKLFVRNLATSAMTTAELEEQGRDKSELHQQEVSGPGEATAPEGLTSMRQDDTNLSVTDHNTAAQEDPSLPQAHLALEEQGDMTEEQREEYNRLNPGSQHIVSQLLHSRSPGVKFSSMSKDNKRKEVASKFYTLLLLKKHEVIEVAQASPFAEIVDTEGPKFDTAAA